MNEDYKKCKGRPCSQFEEVITMKNLYKIDIFTPKGNIYFRTENKYFKNMNECLDYYEIRYPNYNFELKEYSCLI